METATENGVGDLDHVIIAAAIRQSGVVDSSRSVMRVLYTISGNISQMLFISWIKIWRICRTQLKWDKFRSFFCFCNNSTAARAQ